MIIVPNVYYDKVDNVLIHWYNDGQMWYKFYDITSMFDYEENNAIAAWKKFINEDEKTIFEEEYEDFRGNICKNKYKYISTSALFKLCDRYERIIGNIRKHVTKIEFQNGFINKDDSNNHVLQVNIGVLRQCIENNDGDYDKLHSVAKAVCDAPIIQQIEHGNPIKEEIINKFRDDIYDCDEIEEVEWNIKMTKKPGADNEEERKAKYERHKGQGTSCPAWLIDVIK